MVSNRYLQQAIILVYLFLTFCGFLYTFFRTTIPHVPWGIVRHHYNMMAPFQSYVRYNTEVVAEGFTPAGEMVRIPMKKHFPFSRGEQRIRIYLSSFSGTKRNQAYKYIAERIQEREKLDGNTYSQIQLWQEKWPKSEHGYSLRREGETTRTFITQTP